MPTTDNSKAGRSEPSAPRPGSQTRLVGPSRAPGSIRGPNVVLNQPPVPRMSLPWLCDTRKIKAPENAPRICATTRVRRTPSQRTRASVSSIDSDAASRAMLRMAG